jgi:hypothetical protein
MCFTLRASTDSGASRPIAWAESYPDYLDLRDRNQNFDDLVACNAAEIGLDTGEDPSRAWAKDLPELH